MNKKAFITGISGQDGAWLSRLLLTEGYEVYGGLRRNASQDLWRLKILGIQDKIKFVDFELLEQNNIFRLVEKIQPDEIYNLGAQAQVAVSFDQPIFTMQANALGTFCLLEAIRNVNPKIKFYQASSSEMFGKVQEIPQNEKTNFYPRSPYGVSKLAAHWATINYREAFGIFGCCGILFNHEGILRDYAYVTKHVTSSVAKISLGIQDSMKIGSLTPKRDWGSAKEYVRAIYLMMQHKTPETFVVATGENHTILELIEVAFNHVGLDWEDYVRIDESRKRPAEVDILIGDPSKIKSELGWEAKTKFTDLVKEMVTFDLKME